MGLFSTKEGAGIFNAVFIATGEKFAAVVDDCFLLLLCTPEYHYLEDMGVVIVPSFVSSVPDTVKCMFRRPSAIRVVFVAVFGFSWSKKVSPFVSACIDDNKHSLLKRTSTCPDRR